jgi:hypothetical protein
MAMEATIFTGWIYDHLLPNAQQVKVAHPLMLPAIATAKKKDDRLDSGKIAVCLHLLLLFRTSACRTKRNNTRFTIKRWQSQWYASRLTALMLLPPVSSKNGERSTDVPI